MSDQTTPSPFSANGWHTEPTIVKEAESTTETNTTETEVTDVVKDPVIEEKDEKIKEDKIIDDKPDKPEAVPAATPKDIPEKTKEEGKPTSELKLNETSEKIYNLLVEGKEDEIFPILNQRQILKNLDKLPPAEVLKLQIRNENQDVYSPQDIDDIFNERFSLPEKPIQNLESDEEFAVIEAKYKEQLARAERRIERESKAAKTSLAAQLQELVLPNIQKTPEPVKPTQEELERLDKQRENFLQAVDGSLTSLNSYSATFKDEEVEIPVAYAVTKQEKDNLRPLLDSLNTDLPQFFTQLDWFDKDGKLNTNKVVSDLHLIQNKDAVIQKFVNEAGNKRYAEAVKRQKNVDFSGTTRRGNLEPSVQEEVDKKVKSFFAAS